MRKLWLICATLLLSAAWMAAQTTSGSASGTAQSGQAGATAQTGTQTGNVGAQNNGTYGQNNSQSSAGKTTLEGCLSGTEGNYTLTANNGMTYELQGNNNQLNKHLGQEVKVKGSAAVGASSGMATGQSAASSASQQTFQVNKVKKLSKTCTTGNTSNPSSR
jgi:hypothetical protein